MNQNGGHKQSLGGDSAPGLTVATARLPVRSVLGGAIGPWPPPPLGRQDLHTKVSKIEAWTILCKLGIRLWARNYLILGENWDEILVKTFFFVCFFALHLILSENWDEM